MYVAVKGGEAAISAAEALVARRRRGDPVVPDLALDQVTEQMSLAVDRVMAEGGLANPPLAALALKQARGDMTEAAFLLRAYRTTLPRLEGAQVDPVDPSRMRLQRRISAIFKDVPGGQVLGPTPDYIHRLLDFSLAMEADGGVPPAPDLPTAGSPLVDPDTGPTAEAQVGARPVPSALEALVREGLLPGAAAAEQGDPAPAQDITRDPPTLPYSRAQWQQRLACGDEGMLVALAYSSQRGWGHTHPFVGDLRVGHAALHLRPDPEGDPDLVLDLGEVMITECRMVTGFTDTGDTAAASGPHFTEGYALLPGHNERKAMAISLIDRALAGAAALKDATGSAQGETKPLPPVADQEFVLSHCDGVEASGFLQHLKLPHYVDFQSELEMLRLMRRLWAEKEAAEAHPSPPRTAEAEA